MLVATKATRVFAADAFGDVLNGLQRLRTRRAAREKPRLSQAEQIKSSSPQQLDAYLVERAKQLIDEATKAQGAMSSGGKEC